MDEMPGEKQFAELAASDGISTEQYFVPFEKLREHLIRKSSTSPKTPHYPYASSANEYRAV